MQGFDRDVGQLLQDVREEHKKTQDDVARAARRSGFRWTRATVAGLEHGRRAIDRDSLLQLPKVLSALTGAPYTLTVTTTVDGYKVEVGAPGHATTWVESRTVHAPWPRGPKRAAASMDLGGEAEQKVSRRLRVPTLQVALTARDKWGHSLTDERDQRVAALAAPDATPRTLQALKGHVSRELIAELGPIVKPPRAQSSRRSK